MIRQLKNLVIFLAALVISGLLLNIMIDNPFSHRIVINIINEKMRQFEDIKLRFSALEVSAVPPKITLYGAKLEASDQTLTLDPLFESSRAHLRINWSSLLGPEPRISELEFVEPKIHWPHPTLTRILNKHTTKAPDSDQPIPWPPPFNFPLDKISLKSAELKLASDPVIPERFPEFDFLIKGLNLDLEWDSWDQIGINLQIPQLDLKYKGAPMVPEAKVILRALYQNQVLRTSELSVKSQWGNVNGFIESKLVLAKKNNPLITLQKESLYELLGMETRGRLDADLDFRILGSYLEIAETDGRIKGDLRLELSQGFGRQPAGRPFYISGPVKTLKGRIDGYELYETEAELGISTRGLSLKPFHLIREKETLASGSGYITFNQAVDMNFAAELKGITAHRLFSALKVPEFDSFDGPIFSENLSIKATASPFEMKLRALTYLPSIESPPLGEMHRKHPKKPQCQIALDLDIDSDRLAFKKFEGPCSQAGKPIQAQSSVLSMKGILPFETEKATELHLELRNFDLNHLESYSLFSLAGQVDASLDLIGLSSGMDVDGTMKANRLIAAGLEFGQASSGFHVYGAQKKLKIKAWRSESPVLQLLNVPACELGWEEPYPLEAQWQLKGLKAPFGKAIGALVNEDSKWQFAASAIAGSLKGELSKPRNFEGQAKFALSNGQYEGETYFHALKGELKANHNQLESSELEWRLGDLNALADINITKTNELYLKIKTIDEPNGPELLQTKKNPPDQLGLFPIIGPKLREQGLSARLQLDLELEGALDKLFGQIDGNLYGIKVRDHAWSDIKFSGFVNSGKIELPLIAHNGRALVGRFSLDPTHKDLPYSWYFHFDFFDLRSFLGEPFAADPRNYAYIKGSSTLSGSLRNFWQSEGEFALEDLKLQWTQEGLSSNEVIPFSLVEPVKLAISPKGWTLNHKEGLRLKGPHARLSLLTEENQPPARLGLKLRGNVDLAALKVFLPQVESARGQLLLSGHLSGPVSQPIYGLKMTDQVFNPLADPKGFEPLSLGLRDLAPALSQIKVDVELKDEVIRVRQLSGLKGKEGRFNVSGAYSLGANTGAQDGLVLNFERCAFTRYPIPVFETVDATLSGSLSLSGNRLPLKLSGQVSLDEASSITNFDLRNKINSAFGNQSSYSILNQPEDPTLEFAVKINAPGKAYIKNRSLNLYLQADLALGGTDLLPTLNGPLTITKGKLFYRRDFEIKRGVVLFEDSAVPPNPRLDVIGETNVSNYKINVYVSGTAQEPKVSLSADPSIRPDGSPISKIDILYLLSTGVLPSNQSNNLQAGASELFSIAAERFEKPLVRVFELSGQDLFSGIYVDTYTPEVKNLKNGTQTEVLPRLNLPIKLKDDIGLKLQFDQRLINASSDVSLHENINTSVYGGYRHNPQSGDQEEQKLDAGLGMRFRFSFP